MKGLFVFQKPFKHDLTTERPYIAVFQNLAVMTKQEYKANGQILCIARIID